jgi:hypothetical protein
MRLLKAAAAAALLSLVLVSGARGAVSSLPRGPVNAYIYAKATNGYSAQLKSEGDKLRLTISRGLFPSLVYTFHGRVSGAGIHAKIADLGVIDLKFSPSGNVRHGKPPKHCDGPRATQVEGHFVGELDFHAERGVTGFDLTSTKGSVAAPGWRCRKESFEDYLQAAPSGSTYTLLQAIVPGRPGGFTALAAVDAEHPGPIGAEFSASARTHRGSVTVDHLAVALAKNALSFDRTLTTATVDPPRPFTGNAAYCRTCATGSRWTGDLSVLLPGIDGPIAMTGSDYRPTLKSLVGRGPE